LCVADAVVVVVAFVRTLMAAAPPVLCNGGVGLIKNQCMVRQSDDRPIDLCWAYESRIANT
jgi:hypothetical protein